jgi:hypothetical protein
MSTLPLAGVVGPTIGGEKARSLAGRLPEKIEGRGFEEQKDSAT